MQVLRAFATLVVVLTLASPVFGQSAPEGFRDLKWGASQEDVQRAFSAASCKTEPSEFADWRCFLRGEKVNDISVTVLFSGYNTGRVTGLSGFSLLFRSEDVRHIVEAFETRYGPTTKVEQEEFVTKGGGRYPNARWIWEFPTVSVRISQHGGKLGDAHASVTLNAATQEGMARREQRKRGAGKGL